MSHCVTKCRALTIRSRQGPKAHDAFRISPSGEFIPRRGSFGPASAGFFVWYGKMAQYSPVLIEQTISLFEKKTGRVLSPEESRQAVENISGFFQVLQEWTEAKNEEKCEGTLNNSPAGVERKQ